MANNKENEIYKKNALITGASSGIGLELAKLFAKNGYDLILVSRRKKVLQSIADELHAKFGTECEIFEKDLEDVNSAQEIVSSIKRKNLTVDVLVNNAGFGTFGEFILFDTETYLRMIQLNISTLVSLTRLILPEMLKKKNGKILQVASMAAFQPGPLMAIYYASKSFVLSFSEALAYELKDSGVTVTALCPGPVPTEFQKRANFGNPKMMSSILVKSAMDVAFDGYNGLMSGKRIVIPGILNKILVMSEKFTPRSVILFVIKNIMHKRGK